jgi:hypothetical protein
LLDAPSNWWEEKEKQQNEWPTENDEFEMHSGKKRGCGRHFEGNFGGLAKFA